MAWLSGFGCSDSGGESVGEIESRRSAVGETPAEGTPEIPLGETPEIEEEPCVSLCDGVSCGQSDGCGAVCGCGTGDAECVDGTCCSPDCAGKECGSDGCGGTCGECAAGSCADGVCCAPDCTGKACGDNGCGGVCGFCNDPSNPVCTDGVCGPSCVPDCVGKECGFDGCGGSCGLCLETGKPICNDGVCGADESCGPDGCLLKGTVFSPSGKYPDCGSEGSSSASPNPPS